MIDARELVRALGNPEIADWVLIERDLGVAATVDGVRRFEQRKRWQLTVHHDVPSGRGTAHVAIDAVAGDPDVVVDQALALARASIGPAWRSSPLAAAAQVALADDAMAARDPIEVLAKELVDASRVYPVVMVGTAIRVVREHATALSKQGFRHEWHATHVDVRTLAIAGQRSTEIWREARRVEDLRLDDAVKDTTQLLALLASAGEPKPGPCAIVLGPEVLCHGGTGVWAAFASQADAVIERQGLTRYREQSPIAPGAESVAEPLSIASDGALPYGVRSAPLGEEGDAVREFAIVERGIAAGLGLSPREAALRRRDPNGGVRNLVVSRGSWTGGGDGRVVEIHRLRELAIDPYTGEASLAIALGTEAGKPFTGGTVRLDLISALAYARRSATSFARGPYVGPDKVMIERAELVA